MPRFLTQFQLLLAGLVIALLPGTSAFAFDGWLPVPPEDLAMKSFDKAPGAAAIMLYKRVDRDDSSNARHEFHYERIKILTEEGRKYADVEVPFNEFEVALNMSGLRGRTIHPDGTIVEFDGKVFDKEIVKTQDYKYRARTFTLPDVHAGSIIEYQYNLDLNEHYIFDSQWILSSELFVRDAKFTLKPNLHFGIRWAWPAGLPAGTPGPKNDELTHTIAMETHDIPALPIEDHMAPLEELRMRVNFSYQEGAIETDPVKFWRGFGKKENGAFESFIKGRGGLQGELSSILAPSDSPEIKARKIYARAQQIKNLSYERSKTVQEEKRENDKVPKSANDVWSKQEGTGRQINWVFIALARAAGLDATPVLVASRNRRFLNQTLMDTSQLNADVVRLKLDGKEVWVDPGSLHAPFGILPWGETAVGGLALDRDGGSWVQTPVPVSSDHKIIREAHLKLTEEGDLEGKLKVTYTGLEALGMRDAERDEDETARKEYLENAVKNAVPAGIEVTLTNKPEWNSSAPELVAEYDLKVPGWASAAGRRVLVPMGLFGNNDKHMFERADRVNDIYFHYPYRKDEDVSIVLPPKWNVTSTPQPVNQDGKAVAYILKPETGNGSLRISRTVRVDLIGVNVKNYGTLRQYFQIVRTGDEQQAVLQVGN